MGNKRVPQKQNALSCQQQLREDEERECIRKTETSKCQDHAVRISENVNANGNDSVENGERYSTQQLCRVGNGCNVTREGFKKYKLLIYMELFDNKCYITQSLRK